MNAIEIFLQNGNVIVYLKILDSYFPDNSLKSKEELEELLKNIGADNLRYNNED